MTLIGSEPFYLLGSLALIFSLVCLYTDNPFQRRRLAVALMLVGLFVSANVYAAVIQDPCSEEYLRRTCGEWWEWCYYAKGCYLW